MNLESSTASTELDAIRAELALTMLTTSTLNFVVWIDDPKRRDWILERVSMVSDKHPSFTLVLDNTGVCPKAVVTAGPSDAEGHVTVQRARVDIDVTCADAETIARYVTGLYSPGVPTVLWWSGMKESSRPTFEALLPLAGTLLVDSSGATGDDTAIRLLVAFHRERGAVCLRDLAWMRLRPWQDMIANFFDDPKLVAELYSIRRLFIKSGSASEALYLGGWLASRLGWTASGRDAFADAAGKEISFIHERDGELRRVRSVCLDSDTSWYHGEVTSDPNCVAVWVEGEHARAVRLFPLQAIDNASLIERAILETGVDDMFETALRTVGTLLG